MHMKGSPVAIKDALDTENPTHLQANLFKFQMRLPCGHGFDYIILSSENSHDIFRRIPHELDAHHDL
jgi:hypothetical protein